MPEIKSVRWHHDAIIDMMIAEPSIHQNEIARQMGFTPSWLSIIVNSDAFKERLADRKAEIVDPKLAASVRDRLEGVANRAMDKILERLDSNAPFSNKELLEAARLGANHIVGLPGTGNPALTQNNLYVISSPPAPKTTSAWRDMVEDIIPVLPGPSAEGGLRSPVVPSQRQTA